MDSQRGRMTGNRAHATGWQSCTQEGKATCSSGFLSLCLCHQASKKPWPGGDRDVWIQRRTERFSHLLTTMVIQRLFVATRRCLMPKLLSPPSTTREDSPLYQWQDIFLGLLFQQLFLLQKASRCRWCPNEPLSSSVLTPWTAIRAAGTESTTEGAFAREKTDKAHPLCLESLPYKFLQVCSSQCQRFLTP